ncbi:MAG: hypothetical protein OEZ13_10580 [Spirochaetia bacterium]|nr:hypothetical protein [Spirochaetia bacterium]
MTSLERILKRKKIGFFFVLYFFASIIYAQPSIDRYKEKGNNHIRIIERIFKKYPINLKHKSDFEKIKSDWNETVKDLNLTQAKKRKEAQNRLKEIYKKVNKSLETICGILLSYGNDLILNFQRRLDEENSGTIDKEKYANRFQVSRQEFARAQKAFRNQQYDYSAHLFDRGIEILAKTHKALNWTVPPAYRNLIK